MAQTRYDDLTKEELVRLLQSRDRRDATRFGLVWEANEIERDKALNADFVALDWVPDLSCPPCGPAPGRTGDAGADGADRASAPAGPSPAWSNLIIEGDNFDALRYLRMTFAGRVKCVYIDPPYNTGNKDFVYNDRFVDKDDLWRHSKWCEFMYQRLTLAKDLLRQDGVIFVSIGDDEIFQLGQLMQRVFGERNFIANVIWQKVFAPKNTAQHFSDDHDYILVYALSADIWRPNLLPRTSKQDELYKNPDNDPRGPWTSDNLTARNAYSAGVYGVTSPSGRVISGPPPGTYWRVSEPKLRELEADNRIWWGKKGDGVPRLKRFRSEVMEGRIPQTLWFYDEVGHTQDAKKELVRLVEFPDTQTVFSTPKPVQLMERIVRMATGPDDLVLDFFAGSGTTAHAVHKLNAEDGGRRRVILVSNTEATVDDPEKNLCRDVCATRVRRVIEGYGRGESATPGLGGDFAYLRTRRIAPGHLTDIDHAQVWTALQLTHCRTLRPIGDAPVLVADTTDDAGTADGGPRLIYVPHFAARHAKALLDAARGCAAGVVYAWQPALVRKRLTGLDHISVEPVPESLSRRFGLRI